MGNYLPASRRQAADWQALWDIACRRQAATEGGVRGRQPPRGGGGAGAGVRGRQPPMGGEISGGGCGWRTTPPGGGANHGREGCGETSPPTLPAGPRSVFPTVGGRERGRPQTAGSSAVFSRDHRRGCGRQWRRPATDREPIGSAAAFPPPATLRAGGRAPPGRAGTLNTNGAGERERGDRPARRAIQGGRGGIPPQQPGRARTDGQARRNPSEWRGTAAVPLRRGERHDT